MSYPALTIEEIQQLVTLLREIFAFISDRKQHSPAGRFLKNVQVPAALSESIAMHLLEKQRLIPELADYAFIRDGKLADIIATALDEPDLRIEVKATGNQGFQRFRGKDIAAAYLIWIHFDRYFLQDDDLPITVFCIRQPGDHFRDRQEVTIPMVRALSADVTEGTFLLSEL